MVEQNEPSRRCPGQAGCCREKIMCRSVERLIMQASILGVACDSLYGVLVPPVRFVWRYCGGCAKLRKNQSFQRKLLETSLYGKG